VPLPDTVDAAHEHLSFPPGRRARARCRFSVRLGVRPVSAQRLVVRLRRPTGASGLEELALSVRVVGLRTARELGAKLMRR